MYVTRSSALEIADSTPLRAMIATISTHACNTSEANILFVHGACVGTSLTNRVILHMTLCVMWCNDYDNCEYCTTSIGYNINWMILLSLSILHISSMMVYSWSSLALRPTIGPIHTNSQCMFGRIHPVVFDSTSLLNMR